MPASCVMSVDANGDGIDEIFAGGGIGQQDALLAFEGGELKPLTSGFTKANDDPTYGAASIDATQDGLADLFVVRYSGLYF